MPSSDRYEAFVPTVLGNRASPFTVVVGLQRSITQPVSGVDNMELDNGQPVRSRRCEYGCGRRLRSGVTVSYGRDTDVDEGKRSRELIVMGRRMRRLCVQHSMLAIAAKRSLAEASIDPGFTALLDPEDLEVMGTDQE
jgi:hypothetical protein